MPIPTEPIGGIPRPAALIEAIAKRDGADSSLDAQYDGAIRDTEQLVAHDERQAERLRTVALQNAQSILHARSQVDEDVSKHSEWLRVTLASIGDAVISTDADGCVTFMNMVAESLTGWSQSEAMGLALSEIFHIINENTRQAVDKPALRALAQGTIVGLANHTILIARDGTERPIDDSAAPIRASDGQILGAVLVFRDITERHRSEWALRASEERLRMATAAAELGIWGWHLASDRLTWENDQPAKIFGLSPTAAPINAAQFKTEFIHPDDLPAFEAAVANAIATDARFYFLGRIRRADGATRWVELTGRVEREGLGVPARIVGTAADVTQRQASAEQVQRTSEANAKFRTLFEQAAQFAGILSLDGTVVEANRICLDACGFTRDDVLGKPFWECGWWNRSPDAMRFVQAACAEAASGKLFRAETTYFVADGTARFVDLTIAPVVDEQGRILYLFPTGTDITERVAAQEALRESEQRFRLVADAAPVMIWMSGIDKLCTWFNRTWLEFVGRPLEQEIGNGWRDNVHPDDFDRCLNTYHTAFDERRPFSLEYRLRRHDGEYCWLLDTGTPRHESDGVFSGYIGSCVDITERMQSEGALRVSQAQTERQRRLYEAILANTPDFGYVFDREHRFIYANDVLLKMWGRSWDDAIGKTCHELGYEPWHAEMHDREIDQVIATRQPIRGQVPFTGTFGRRIYEYIFVPVIGENGEVEAVAGTTRDVTEHQQAEETLRQRAEEIRILLDTLPIGVFIAHDPLCRQITGNPAAHELLRSPQDRNLSLTAPAGEQPTHFRVWRDGVEVPNDQLPMQRAARGEHVRNDELDHQFDDGTVLHALISAAPLLDERGRPRAVASVLDVTRLKEIENELRDADRRKDEFLATLAHELRNPLAAIHNGLQLMRVASDDANLMAEVRTILDRQVTQLVRLVDDLLDVSRISKGKLELRKERIQLAAVLASAMETSRPLIEEMGHELTVSLPKQPVFLDADLTRLAQVFMNLLNNAAKYSERGGSIRLSAELADHTVVVSVRDSGVGIPAHMLPHIFEMFTQVDESSRRSQGGLGIGLTLVRRLVGMHGGEVTAHSDGAGAGSEFIVRLPIVVDGQSPGPVAAGSEPALTTARRILVVDDNRDAASSLAMLLKLAGNETRTAFDGAAAVESAALFRPSVVLLDIGLPHLNGYEVAQQIRAADWGKSMVLVALTGWGQTEDRQKSQAAGFNAHLVKPVDHAALVKLLTELLPAGG